jgi:CheY-like chemotaxis protein
MADFGDLLQGVAAVLWVALALVAFVTLRSVLTARIPSLTKLGLSPAGVSMEFAEQKLDEAVERTSPDAQRSVGQVTKRTVLNRVERNADLLARARIVWVDDHPENNASIVDLLRHFGTVVETSRTNADALALLESSRFDAIVSDVARDDEGPSSDLKGVELAQQVVERFGQRTILFTARFDPTTLPGASDADRLALTRLVQRAVAGRTSRFDEALHLILDELERNLL